jgi:hypothetical protein
MAARQARVELRRRVDEAKETYKSGRAGTAPVRLPSSPGPEVVRSQPEVVVTGTATERDAGDLAG